MTGPLSTLRVIEFSGLGPAPLAGQLLADLGADVICVDRKTKIADPTDINRRGKRSVALNLKTPEGREAALKLIESADLLIEGFRPGVMERLGLGPADCSDQLIYGRMTGWGQTGPLSQMAGHDINFLAMTGALHAMGHADRPPVPPLNLVADFGGGAMFLLFGLLAAVIERNVSGKGQVVDAAMIDGVPAMMGLIHGMVQQGRWSNSRGSNWLDGASHFYRCYECADGRFLSVGALEPRFFQELIRGLNAPDSLVDDHLDPNTWSKKTKVLAQIFLTRTRDEWARHFEGTDACVAPVLDFTEASLHPANQARGVFSQNQGGLQANPAPRFSRSVVRPVQTPTAIGSDTEDVLREVGISLQSNKAMKASGGDR